MTIRQEGQGSAPFGQGCSWVRPQMQQADDWFSDFKVRLHGQGIDGGGEGVPVLWQNTTVPAKEQGWKSLAGRACGAVIDSVFRFANRSVARLLSPLAGIALPVRSRSPLLFPCKIKRAW